MRWRKEDKYCWFLKPFQHFQIDKFNGTKGNVTINIDNIGVYNEETGMYDFKEVKGDYAYVNHNVKPSILSGLILPLKGRLTQTKDSFFDGNFQDEDDMQLHLRFELRILKAKSQIDINMARLYFEAGQIDRLSIKQSLMRLKEPLPSKQ